MGKNLNPPYQSWIAGVVFFLLVGLSACATVPKSPEEAQKDAAPEATVVPFGPVSYWNTDYGPMRLQVSGLDGEGVYPDYKGELILSLRAGNVLQGFWIQPASKKTCGFELAGSVYWGSVRFERVSEKKIVGKWAYCNEPEGSGGIWNGVQIGHPGI